MVTSRVEYLRDHALALIQSDTVHVRLEEILIVQAVLAEANTADFALVYPVVEDVQQSMGAPEVIAIAVPFTLDGLRTRLPIDHLALWAFVPHVSVSVGDLSCSFFLDLIGGGAYLWIGNFMFN